MSPSRQTPIATEAFPRWIELLNLDPSEFTETAKEEGGNSWSTTLGEMGRMDQAIAVFNCFSLDDGELTAQLMLSKLLSEYVEDHSYTMRELLDNAEQAQRELSLVKGIRAVLASDDVVLRRAEFTESLEGAMHHYGAQGREDVQELIEDDAGLANLRRSALTAIHDMATAQFLRGDTGSASRPQYSTVIRRWWNMDHLLAAHASIPEGVSLNLVKTPAEHDMFFCFVVRRGGNLYVLNDAPDYEHPLQSQMSRRPDRNMANRINKFWFPYDLADVQVSEDGRSARIDKDRGARTKGLEIAGRINELSQVLGSVSDLPPHELLWTAMVFDMIMDRFWTDQPLPSLPLSYTAAQLRPEGQLLLEAAKEAGLPVVVGQPGNIAVPDLSVFDVSQLHTSPEAEAILGETGDYCSLHWLENRYASQVPEEALNLISSGNDMARIGLDGLVEVVENPNRRQMETERFFGREKALVSLQSLEQTSFGTAEEMRANRAFLARHNYASTISALAKKEFKQRQDEVRKWLDQAYAKRIDFLKTLVPAAHSKSLVVLDWDQGEGPEAFEFKGGHNVTFGRQRGVSDREDTACSHELGWISPVNESDTAFMSYLPQGGELTRSWKPLCQVTGQSASFFFAVRPTNTQELSWLLGVGVADLPDVLQHHSALVPECGNQILNRIDPMLWALGNPWLKMNLGVRMGLSKRGLAQLLKAYPREVDVSSLARANLYAFKP